MKNDIQALSVMESNGIYDSHYFRFPYKFYMKWVEIHKDQLNEFEAILMIVAKVNYADLPLKIGTKEVICQRGESYRSLTTWSGLFHWDVSKTRRFLMKLKDMGYLEVENMIHTTRIRFIPYDYFVGVKPKDSAEEFTDSFNEFWDKYHETTSMQATDKAAAAKLWQMLDSVEKRLATENIIKYYYNLGNTRYCVKALTYLRNKKFNDEFYY